MQSLSSELKSVIGRHIDAARPDEILRITSVLCFDESVMAEPAAALRRFELVGTWGVRDHRTGFLWTREPVVGGKRTWKESIDAAAKVDFGGHTWRAPTIIEQLSLVDYERHDPAIGSEFVCPSDWFWTSTVDCESPGGCAWSVYFGNGYSNRSNRSSSGFVRAVCVGQ